MEQSSSTTRSSSNPFEVDQGKKNKTLWCSDSFTLDAFADSVYAYDQLRAEHKEGMDQKSYYSHVFFGLLLHDYCRLCILPKNHVQEVVAYI